MLFAEQAEVMAAYRIDAVFGEIAAAGQCGRGHVADDDVRTLECEPYGRGILCRRWCHKRSVLIRHDGDSE
jgi:hypothetical protein